MGERHGEPAESQQPHTPDKKKKTGGMATRSTGMAAVEALKRAIDPTKRKHPLGKDPEEHVDRPDPEP